MTGVCAAPAPCSTLAALAAVLGPAAPARAGDYQVVLDPAQGLSGGWSWTARGTGYSTCGLDGVVACPSLAGPSAWVAPGASVARTNNAIVSLTAPAGTSIVGGTLSLDTALTHDQSFSIG